MVEQKCRAFEVRDSKTIWTKSTTYEHHVRVSIDTPLQLHIAHGKSTSIKQKDGQTQTEKQLFHHLLDRILRQRLDLFSEVT